MLDYHFEKTTWNENLAFFERYFQSLSGKYESFMENHILQSAFFSISIHTCKKGYFAIYHDTLLTQFYLDKRELKYAQIIFQQILEQFGIKQAFVPTCDELLLSLSMDNHKKANLQAYFFTENEDCTSELKLPRYERDLLRLAKDHEAGRIAELSGDFFDNLKDQIHTGQIYVLEEKNEILGFGIIEDCNIFSGHKAIGMFTVEIYRQTGVGRSIILHLKDICHERGFQALAGCWYYNHNSKRTLESCGFVSKTRLLCIDF